ncbi:MAG: Vps62-related protein [Bacteroidales bacterium]
MMKKCFDLTLFYPLFLTLLSIISGCNKESADPDSEPDPVVNFDPELLVSRLSIALVKEGVQEINVPASDDDANPEDFTATSGDEGIAIVTISDASFTVTGVDYGTTEITINSASGKNRTIPVKVYDPQVLETDELLITFSQDFEFSWSDYVSSSWVLQSKKNGSFWHPLTDDDFKPLGSFAFSDYDDPSGKQGVIMVKARNGSDALASPVDYIQLFGIKPDFQVHYTWSLWIPVPPPGYKAMGIVAHTATGGEEMPDLDAVVCVREDLAIAGLADDLIQHCISGMFMTYSDLASWKIEPLVSGPHENAYLSPGTFVSAMAHLNDPVKPSVHSVMNVLDVNLPVLSEVPYQQYVPSLTGFDPPPDETVPVLGREMLVPCTIISDPYYYDNEKGKLANSPFYLLERQVFYKLLYHNHNQSSLVQENSWSITTGVATAESNTFWEETGISISAEAGISFKGVEGNISATVSRSFGYSTMTSISEFEQKTILTGINIPPGKAGALWQRYNRFVLKRHNGTTLEPVKAWEFGMDSFTVAEYPE